MTITLIHLRKLAKGAVPGPWHGIKRTGAVLAGNARVAECPPCEGHKGERNLKFIAAANPKYVLGMIDQIEMQQQLLEELKAASEERDVMAAHVERLRNAMNLASDEHIGFAKRMALRSNTTAMQAVDKADALLVHESFHVPIDTSCLLIRDTHQKVKALSDAAESLIKDFNATDTLTANQAYQRLADRSRELRRSIEEKETTPCPTQS